MQIAKREKHSTKHNKKFGGVSGNWTMVYRSETMHNNQNPMWAPFNVNLVGLCGGNFDTMFKVCVLSFLLILLCSSSFPSLPLALLFLCTLSIFLFPYGTARKRCIITATNIISSLSCNFDTSFQVSPSPSYSLCFGAMVLSQGCCTTITTLCSLVAILLLPLSFFCPPLYLLSYYSSLFIFFPLLLLIVYCC